MPPSSTRAAALVAWLPLGVSVSLALTVSAAPAGPHAARPSPRYLELAERYAAGSRAEAVGALGGWTEHELEAEFEELRDLAVAAGRCGACPAKLQLERLPLRAVVMLHTDRDDVERWPVLLVDERGAKCGSGVHAGLAAEIVPLLMGELEGREFARRWYLAMALRAHGRFCLSDALRWAQKGLKWFPKDAGLLLASGTTDEALGSLPSWSRDRLGDMLTTRQRREATSAVSAQRRHLEYARRSFEHALAADADLTEARLRLGRVEWRLEHADAARTALEGALDRTQEPFLLYLGRLFLGQIHQDAGRLAEAEREYRAALGVDPHAQAAAVALSHVLQLAGDAAESRDVLERAVASAGRRRSADAYWDYLFGRSDDAETLLEALRQETRK